MLHFSQFFTKFFPKIFESPPEKILATPMIYAIHYCPDTMNWSVCGAVCRELVLKKYFIMPKISSAFSCMKIKACYIIHAKENKGSFWKRSNYVHQTLTLMYKSDQGAVCRDLELKNSYLKKYCVKKGGLQTRAKLMQSQKVGLFSLACLKRNTSI